MNILKEKVIFFNRILPLVPKQLRSLYEFGTNTLTLQHISSLRGNARQVVRNFHTAKSKAYRLTTKTKWQAVFMRFLASLKLVNADSVVALDFSDFLRFQVLTFALQTRRGRAIPLYIELLKYPIREGSQNLFVVRAVETFVSVVGCRPKIVMDRGFACPHIIKEMAKQGHQFIVRIKQNKYLTDEETSFLFKAKESGTMDLRVVAYEGTHLRLVVSDQPESDGQRWYLLTNDFSSIREELIRQYYHRFEIEEFFKDAKWLMGLEHLKLKTMQSLLVVLWFVMLGFWFMAGLDKLDDAMRGAQKSLISFPRFVLEEIHRETYQLAAAAYALSRDG